MDNKIFAKVFAVAVARKELDLVNELLPVLRRAVDDGVDDVSRPAIVDTINAIYRVLDNAYVNVSSLKGVKENAPF